MEFSLSSLFGENSSAIEDFIGTRFQKLAKIIVISHEKL